MSSGELSTVSWPDMINTYRIAQEQYIEDLSGYGSYLYGGRWNLPGVYALYLASHKSLAYLEYLVHQYNREIWPKNLMVASIEIDDLLIRKIKPEELPSSWTQLVYQIEIQLTCTRFFTPEILGIEVPSVVVPEESNYILNPAFTGFYDRVKITDLAPANFDERLKPNPSS